MKTKESTARDVEKDLVIIGLPLRTRGDAAMTEIGPHWARFIGEGWPARLPSRADDDGLYAVYCDYESDGDGAYTMVLGRAVEPGTAVPSGLRRVTVPAGRYAAFDVKGATSELWQTWQFINRAWAETKGRRFIADLERYRPSSTADSVDAEILVGVA